MTITKKVFSPVFTGPFLKPFGDQSAAVFLASDLPDLRAWFLANRVNSVTVTGAGVSTWADQSGNGEDLVQTTDADRPAYVSGVSVDFDGVSEFLERLAAGFTSMSLPYFVGIVFESTSQTSGDGIYDLLSGTRPQLNQIGAPADDYRIFNGNFLTSNSNQATGVFHILTIKWAAGANTSLYINGVVDSVINNADAGSGILNGIILGAVNLGAAGWANIKVKEFIISKGEISLSDHNSLGNGLAETYGLPWTDIPAFSPLDLNPTAFFDASDAGDFTFSSGNKVSQWDDLSGNDDHAIQADTDKQPTHDAVNKRVLFDGVDDWLEANWTSFAQPSTIFCVFQQVSTGSNEHVYGGRDGTRQSLLNVSAAMDVFGGSATEQLYTPSDTAKHITAVIYNGASSDGYNNGGTDQLSTNIGTMANSGVTMAARNDKGAGTLGNLYMHFFATFPSALSTSDLNDLGNYLKDRFAGFTWTDIS